MEFFLVATENGALGVEWSEAAAPPACPVCGRHTRPDPAMGYEVVVADASELKDLNHAAPVYVASPRFAAWYERTGQTGLAFDPLPRIEGRLRARITGAARLPPSSGATATVRCDHCGYRYYEVDGPWRIDEEAWDRSGFFQVSERPGAMFCSRAAKAAVEEAGLTGAVFLEMDLVAL